MNSSFIYNGSSFLSYARDQYSHGGSSGGGEVMAVK